MPCDLEPSHFDDILTTDEIHKKVNCFKNILNDKFDIRVQLKSTEITRMGSVSDFDDLINYLYL